MALWQTAGAQGGTDRRVADLYVVLEVGNKITGRKLQTNTGDDSGEEIRSRESV